MYKPTNPKPYGLSFEEMEAKADFIAQYLTASEAYDVRVESPLHPNNMGPQLMRELRAQHGLPGITPQETPAPQTARRPIKPALTIDDTVAAQAA